ncbi:MAG: hypothetical protein R3B68_00390 [Phycisphaerales bacterium]
MADGPNIPQQPPGGGHSGQPPGQGGPGHPPGQYPGRGAPPNQQGYPPGYQQGYPPPGPAQGYQPGYQQGYPPPGYPQGYPQYQQPWPQQPQGPSRAQVAAQQVGAAAMKHGRSFWDEALLCLQRVTRSDFQTERATEVERAKLGGARHAIVNPMVQDFVAWRRSVLWVAAVLIAIYAFFQIVTFTTFEAAMGPQIDKLYEEAVAQARAQGFPVEMSLEEFREASMQQFGRKNAEVVDAINGILATSVFLAAICIGIAAKWWKSVPASRLWSRVAWGIMFCVPMLLSFFPITWFMSFDHVQEAHAREAQRQAMGTVFALGVFMMIAPKAIALFPGIIRSAISLKTLVPESVAPGWVAATMAPLYAIFLFTLVSMINQSQGDIFLILGVLCFMTGPLVYIVFAKRLVRPHAPSEASTVVRGLRRLASGFTVVGAVLMSIFVLRLPHLSFWDAVGFLFGVGGNLLLMTVVSSDLVLALLYQSYRQARAFAGTELEASLDEKFAALSQVGFTALVTTTPARLIGAGVAMGRAMTGQQGGVPGGVEADRPGPQQPTS